jgi:murein DD-endopeptidase MepM/ murein hydrolase activator NlpD
LFLRRLSVCCLSALAICAVPSTAAADGSSGGASIVPPPVISQLVCDDGRVAACGRSQSLTIRGEWLSGAKSVRFLGGRGRRDDRSARVRKRTDSSLVILVPWSAKTGPLTVVAKSGKARPRRVRVTKPSAIAQAGIDKFFIDGPQPVLFDYIAAAGSTVELVRIGDGSVVRSWPASPNGSGQGSVSWNGRLGGKDAASGRYGFRVTPAGAAPGEVTRQFAMLDHIFPIRGKHDLGQSNTNGFGGGRGHQGVDMFAKCGTRLAAARGGEVIMSAFQARAGNYVVIRRADGQSYAYMHLKQRSSLRQGDKVRTGQFVGLVGATGRASGCHLHFELWTAPGWYKGGHPVDPMPLLRIWDAWS